MAMSGDDFIISNTTVNGDIIFKVNDGGATTTVMTMDGATGGISFGEGGVGDFRVTGNLIVDGTTTTINTAIVVTRFQNVKPL